MKTERLDTIIQNEKENRLSLPMLEFEMGMIGFKYLGEYNSNKLYGSEHDRLLYEKIVNRTGIYYQFRAYYKSPEYIVSGKSDIDRLIEACKEYLV